MTRALRAALVLTSATTGCFAQSGTLGLRPYANVLSPNPAFISPYVSASSASSVANAAIKTNLNGKVFRVAASYYDLSAGATNGTYEVDALAWITPSAAAVTAFNALPVGSALLLNTSDVTGTGPCLLNLICAQVRPLPVSTCESMGLLRICTSRSVQLHDPVLLAEIPGKLGKCHRCSCEDLILARLTAYGHGGQPGCVDTPGHPCWNRGLMVEMTRINDIRL
jgi:hypothetical protein